ncbi:MAG: L-arabinose isomerase, partial [Hymenobacter sp.]
MTYETRIRAGRRPQSRRREARGLRDAARIELGMRKFLTDRRAKGFTDTFEDLHGL